MCDLTSVEFRQETQSHNLQTWHHLRVGHRLDLVSWWPLLKFLTLCPQSVFRGFPLSYALPFAASFEFLMTCAEISYLCPLLLVSVFPFEFRFFLCSNFKKSPPRFSPVNIYDGDRNRTIQWCASSSDRVCVDFQVCTLILRRRLDLVAGRLGLYGSGSARLGWIVIQYWSNLGVKVSIFCLYICHWAVTVAALPPSWIPGISYFDSNKM